MAAAGSPVSRDVELRAGQVRDAFFLGAKDPMSTDRLLSQIIRHDDSRSMGVPTTRRASAPFWNADGRSTLDTPAPAVVLAPIVLDPSIMRALLQLADELRTTAPLLVTAWVNARRTDRSAVMQDCGPDGLGPPRRIVQQASTTPWADSDAGPIDPLVLDPSTARGLTQLVIAECCSVNQWIARRIEEQRSPPAKPADMSGLLASARLDYEAAYDGRGMRIGSVR